MSRRGSVRGLSRCHGCSRRLGSGQLSFRKEERSRRSDPLRRMNRRGPIVFVPSPHYSTRTVVCVRRLFVNHNAVQGKAIDLGHCRRSVWIHARDLNHDSPTIVVMIGMQLVLVLFFGVDNIRCRLPARLHRGYGKKEAHPKGIHHGQTGSRRSMNPGGVGKIQSIRGDVARAPLRLIQGFQISLEAKFSGASRQPNPFHRGLEKIAIHVFVGVCSLLSNRVGGKARRV
mmetsp:Transcript_6603/g.16095  ORF Transcript_6603/g.16095 Transcript_6603/m.16095 type:complete len:229 (+) Transcript_6603:926-1612(+)